jgi:Xaa-Pro dipeptidase
MAGRLPGSVRGMSDEEPIRVAREELDRRHEALWARLPDLGVDLALVATNPNLYYLAGSMQEGLLAISPSLPGPVYLAKRVHGRARLESALDDVRPAVSPRKLCEALGMCPVKRLGLELDSVPYAWADRLRKGMGGEGIELVDVSAALREVRSVKSPWEVRMLEAAAAQSDAAMERVAEVLREGVTELELSKEIVATMRGLGWEGFVRMHRFGSEIFLGGVMSGASATRPSFHQAVMGGRGLSPALPHGASRRKVARGEPVAVDLCGVHAGYISDTTRTFSVGPLPEELRARQLAGQDILYTLERELRPGASLSGIWDIALRLAEERGVAEGFMGVGGEKMRFIGHGVGLELDELPVLADGFPGTLLEGATVAVEPKLVYPDVGVLGEENTYLVTADGPRQLTLARKGPIEV